MIRPATHGSGAARAAAFVLAAAAFVPRPAHADSLSEVVGPWQVISDETGKPDGVVRLSIVDGKLTGVIEKLPSDATETTCTKCSPPQKDKPLVGLVFMWGLTRHGDEWSGGTVLDPRKGTTYRCTVTPIGHDRLKVRGYIGISLFGRSQEWVRPH